ncbi:MAG: ABC transporter substrate-binding protein [Actinomycetota bacterium]|nr:ABC transporter substrate-binding protein [Actinomycetota bacterium]
MDSESGWRIRLLGSVAIVEDGREIAVGGRAQRTLLAVLAVNRGLSVSVERLVEELWPSGPPPGAVKTLQVYISRLRSVLGAYAVSHRAGGYTLLAAAGTVDVDEFERRYENGRTLRADGDSRAARVELRAALAMWQGAAIGGITDGALIPEIERLESLRLVALEERIEAELDLGRHDPLVPELERLVREHPFRETLRRQLMLALYRSGRQADALSAYREGRETLRDELGLEPRLELTRLERAILNHEPELDRPPAPPPPAVAQRPSVAPLPRRSARLAVGGILLLGAAAIVTAPLSLPGHAHLAVAPDVLEQIDPGSNSLVAGLSVGTAPVAVTTGAGSVWVANAGDPTLTRVDPAHRRVLGRTRLGRIPSQIAYGDAALWVASAIGKDGVVQRINPASGLVVSTTTVRVGAGAGDDLFAPATPNTVAAGAGQVWTNNLVSNISRVDASHSSVVIKALPSGHSVDGIAVGAGSLWVASGSDDRVLRLDPGTGAVTAEIPIAAERDARVASPYGIVVAYGAVWVTDALSNTVSQIDPHLNAVTATIRVGARPTRIAAGEGGVWVVNAGDESITRIDPHRATVAATIAIGAQITGVAAGLHSVWITVGGGVPSQSSGHRPPTVRLLAGCTALTGQEGHPDLLIASEFPTYRDGLAPDPVVADMRAAILAVFRQHHFRAGPYRVGYQACDDSNPGAGPSPERCAANAGAYSLNASLVGVIGTFDSGCAQIQLATLNVAAGGPIAMVSPTNTYVGLTRAGPATAADEPDRYRPTGALNYVRLLGPDNVQGAGIAMHLQREARERVYLLDDGGATGFAGATYVARAAAKLGLTIAGRRSWAPTALDYRDLAQRIKATRADAIVLSGCVCSNGLNLLTDLRAALGAAPRIVGTDNFTETGDEYRTKFGRLGLQVASAGLNGPSLGTAGRSLLNDLAFRAHLAGGDTVDPFAAYAGAATSVLLDAIAKSDGTRTSVDRALFATNLRTSPIGSIKFDADGDVVAAPITIYRVDATVPYRSHHISQGLVPVRTYVPPADLAK